MTDTPNPARRHPATTGLLRWFDSKHLPKHLQPISVEFSFFAGKLVQMAPDGPELTTALRKLLEAKDCAVRAAIEGLEAAGWSAE